MPRRKDSPYIPWTSKNVVFLKSLTDATDIEEPDWRQPNKKSPARRGQESKILHSVDGAAGRAHREEAILIELLGKVNVVACQKCANREGAFLRCVSVAGVHRGACACCVWDSKAISCNLKPVRALLRKELKDKEELDEIKNRTRAVRGNVSSKKPRSKPVVVDSDSESDQNDEQD